MVTNGRGGFVIDADYNRIPAVIEVGIDREFGIAVGYFEFDTSGVRNYFPLFAIPAEFRSRIELLNAEYDNYINELAEIAAAELAAELEAHTW